MATKEEKEAKKKEKRKKAEQFRKEKGGTSSNPKSRQHAIDGDIQGMDHAARSRRIGQRGGGGRRLRSRGPRPNN